MAAFGERLRKLRKQRGWTQDELAELAGTSKQVISRYETGNRTPKITVAREFAAVLQVPLEYLVGSREPAEAWAPPDAEPLPAMRRIPLLGTIACGQPILAEDNLEGFVNAPEGLEADYGLRCRGDSMINARIFDGDLVFIRQQPDVENGEIAAILIGNEATLKRVYKYENRLELRPENPTFPVLNYEGEKLEEIRIIGKAVAFLSAVR